MTNVSLIARMAKGSASPLRLVRSVMAGVLIVFLLGLGGLVRSAAGMDELPCSTDCEGSDRDKRCPPSCTEGSCAKVLPSIVASTTSVPTRLPSGQWVELLEVAPASLPALDGVFQPPRS